MGAYYKRNNSFSRSFNAEQAENENRYPLTRAAEHLGISVKSFKNGLDKAEIKPNEWHHVGKFANKVDYYDVSENSEIVQSIAFWDGAINKINKKHCAAMRLAAIKLKASENLKQKLTVSTNFKNPSFAKKLQSILHPKTLERLVNILKDRTKKESIFIRTGAYKEYSEMRCNQWGRYYEIYHDAPITVIKGGSIAPFNLSPFGLKTTLNNVRDIFQKQKARPNNRGYQKKYSFSRSNVKAILDRRIRGVVFNNSLTHCSFNDFLCAAKICKKLYGFDYEIKADAYGKPGVFILSNHLA